MSRWRTGLQKFSQPDSYEGELEDQKQSIHFMRIASSFLILVMLVMGITMMNNYDKIQSVQKSLEALTESAQSEQEAKESA